MRTRILVGSLGHMKAVEVRAHVFNRVPQGEEIGRLSRRNPERVASARLVGTGYVAVGGASAASEFAGRACQALVTEQASSA